MSDRIKPYFRLVFIAGLCLSAQPAVSQSGAVADGTPKVTKTSMVCAGFLTYGIGGPTDAAADAQVAFPNGLLSLTGNPAHAAMLGKYEISITDKPVKKGAHIFIPFRPDSWRRTGSASDPPDT